LTVTAASTTSVTLSWTAATGAVGYGVYAQGSLVDSTSAASYTFSGLTCGTSYTLGANSVGASGATSSTATKAGSTSACPQPPPPPPSPLSVATNIADGSTVSGSVTWTATPSAAVAEVDFVVDGTQRWVEKVSPYQYNGDPNGVLDTRTLTDGTHTLAATAVTSGGTKVTVSRTVTVKNSTTAVTVTNSIAQGAKIGGNVKWIATPSAPVTEVDFLIDGVQRWVEKVSPYQYNGDPNGTLDTTTLANGSHTLTAVAIASGLRATSSTTVTVSNTTATPTSTTNNVVFDAGYETNNTSQWTWGMQCVNTGTPSDYITRGTINVESDVVGQGNYAGRFDLPASGQRTACEGLRKRTLNLGGDDYYSMMFRLPTNWQEPSPEGWGMALAQFNYQLIWGPPIGLFAHGGHVSLVTQTGFCNDVNSVKPGCTYSSGPGGNLPQMYAVPTLKTGVWNELVVHVHWAADSTGSVEVWHRLKGDSSWTKTVTFSGYPTIQWSAAQPVNPTQMTSDKFGAYRGAASFPMTIWQDGVAVATSFSAAANHLP
jgi:hypothetical protein